METLSTGESKYRIWEEYLGHYYWEEDCVAS